MDAVANLADEAEHIGATGVSRIYEKIGVPVAYAGITHGKALERQFIDHLAGRPATRVFKDASGAFLVEGLAGAAFFVADANPLENLAVWLGGQLQFHREHNIIGRK
jgi:hypothetical protein